MATILAGTTVGMMCYVPVARSREWKRCREIGQTWAADPMSGPHVSLELMCHSTHHCPVLHRHVQAIASGLDYCNSLIITCSVVCPSVC